jgi:hypothetical protein
MVLIDKEGYHIGTSERPRLTLKFAKHASQGWKGNEIHHVRLKVTSIIDGRAHVFALSIVAAGAAPDRWMPHVNVLSIYITLPFCPHFIYQL